MNPKHFVIVPVDNLPVGLSLKTPVINRYLCERCNVLHETIELAGMCCDPHCVKCGNDTTGNKGSGSYNGRAICKACSALALKKSHDDYRNKMLRKSQIIGAPTCNFVFHPDLPREGYVNLDDYPENTWTLPEIIADVCNNAHKPIPVPSYVHDCNVEYWHGLDLDDILENDLSDWYEDAGDNVVGSEELKEAIAAFNAKQNLKQYTPADRVIPLDTDAFNKTIQEVAGEQAE